MPQESDEPEYSAACLWLVDGYNVLRVSMPTGNEDGSLRPWWTAERRTALLELAARLPEPQAEVWVVFDGKHLTEPRTQAVPRTSTALPSRAAALGPGPRSVGCVFAPSADEWIVQALKARDGRSGTAVVTADRPLASRSRALGAKIVSTGRFVERCAGTPDVS